uniref:HAD family hydrolase n=1 Tax=Ascaris lumbricoides TaxID=6252 RepID=A0A0M3I8X2_ASCLU
MVSRRLLVLNFEGVITTNPDPYALFIEKGVQLGLEAAHNLQRERIASPKKNLLHFISRLFVDLCRQTGLELQEISERFAAETHLYPGGYQNPLDASRLTIILNDTFG